MECFEIKNLTASCTIKIFREIFSRFGLPKEITTDNGGTFISEEFFNFLRLSGIKHLTGAPYHPATNGQAESAVKATKRAVLKARHEDSQCDLHLLNRFLFYHRNTPHTTTGEKPSKLLFGRHLRTKFDLLMPSTATVVENKQKYQKEHYQGRKRISQFVVNDPVWVKDFRVPSKPTWCPGNIIQILGKRTYLIKTDCGMEWRRHIDQIKKNFIESNLDHDLSIIPRSALDKNENVASIQDNRDNSASPNFKNRSETSENRDTNSEARSLRRRSQLKQPDRLVIE